MEEAKQKRSGVSTTLDRLTFGTQEDADRDFTLTRKQRRILPEGIRKRELYKDVLMIAGPSLAEMLLSSLVRIIDQMMVGTLGPEAISAVGLVVQPTFLLQSIVMSLNTGATAIIARARGADDRDRANSVLRQALVIGTLIGIFCTLLGTFGSRFMVTFMAGGNISPDIVEQGISYFRIQSLTFLIPSWSFCITAALRGTGNSKPCMVYNIVANLVNIVMNALLINGLWIFPKWGVSGAAIATAIGQAVGTAMAFRCVINGKYYLKLKITLKNVFEFDRDAVKGMMNVGLPAMIEQMFMRVGLIIYSRTVAGLGDIDFATHNICLSAQTMTIMNGQAFAVSATSLIGQSLGKKRLDMAEHYGRYCRQAAQVISLVIAVVFLLFPDQILGMFLSAPDSGMTAAEAAQRLLDNQRVLETGKKVMFLLAFMQPIQCSQFVVGGILRGAGDTKVTATIILFTTVFFRTVLAYLFVTVFGWGLLGAWMAHLSDQAVRTGLFFWRLNQGNWKRIKL
ncbi:MAG: MATE family efflux transporter [Oscillospiraceae bacterium]|jgi:putative MATE family efflux protein|nr:MATE family efflux transporter [Oscillospiraceae bacterium]